MDDENSENVLLEEWVLHQSKPNFVKPARASTKCKISEVINVDGEIVTSASQIGHGKYQYTWPLNVSSFYN